MQECSVKIRKYLESDNEESKTTGKQSVNDMEKLDKPTC
jgi:hypothetical protein